MTLAVERWPAYPAHYFNQAGSGPARPDVRARVREMDDHLAAIGAHSAAGLAYLEATLRTCRGRLLAALGAPVGWSVSFTTSATDALNLVAAGLQRRVGRIVVSDQEHPSGMLSMALQRARGFAVEVVCAEPLGTWAERVEEARRAADLVLVSLVSYRSGWRFPLERLDAPSEGNGLLALDVSQAFGNADLDPAVWVGADVVLGLGHKWLHGPLPTGFLAWNECAGRRIALTRGGWHARDASDGLEADWRGDARRYEPGSLDLARIAGLVEAAEGAGALTAQRERVLDYRARVVEALERAGTPPLPGGETETGIVVARLPRPARETAAAFLAHGVTVKDLNPPECPDLLRISLCAFHTDDEVERLCGAITAVLCGRSGA